jgi:hypothetical protein
MDISEYRASDAEQGRTEDLMGLVPPVRGSALDVGARDGHFSRLLADKFDSVTALDLETPEIEQERVQCVQGDVTDLEFEDNTFDFVFCAEVLEHIPTQSLAKACSELSRVSRRYALIGVPYKQDIRVGRTTCRACGEKNPPWGHVNRFDEARLQQLFPAMAIESISFMGQSDSHTNWISTLLMDWSGNPYGTYDQEEPCIHCGQPLGRPPERTVPQKLLTRAAVYTRNIQKPFVRPHGNWIHVLFEKKHSE